MTVRSMKLCSALVGAGLLVFSAPVLAAAPQATAPAADVATLVSQLQAAIADAQAKFTSGESDGDKEAAIQAAVSNTIASSGFDAVTTQAALKQIQGSAPLGSPTRQAANNALRTVGSAAQQETQSATSIGSAGSAGTGSAGTSTFSYSAGSSGGGGGYVTGK